MKKLCVIILSALLLLSIAVVVIGAPITDEFVGLFPSWVNVKTDCGAVGDGKADDTVAIQKAIETAAAKTKVRTVVYFPAGTYRMTKTLMLRKDGTGYGEGVNIYGEDPQRTVLVWDGAAKGTMFDTDSWYFSMGRLTFDGRGKAKIAIAHGPTFVSGNELFDLVIKDVDLGIECGVKDGIAETSVLRCKFYRCAQAGISLTNWNSLDWWIWDCLFEDCNLGVTNELGTGNFHVYRSVFHRSKRADVSIGHTIYFSIFGNYSEGSKAFFLARRPEVWAATETHGALTTIQRNVIVNPQDTNCIDLHSNGTFLLLDNTIVSKPNAKGPVVTYDCPGTGDIVAIGNTFTQDNPLAVQERMTAFDNTTRKPATVIYQEPVMPVTPPLEQRPVLEVPTKATTEQIQQIIDQAALMKGQRPVVHFMNGNYAVKRTLVIPANCPMTLEGDGSLNATIFSWEGEGVGPVLLLKGPSQVVLSHFCVNGGHQGIGIISDNCDQHNGRVTYRGGGTGPSGDEFALIVNGLDQTYVELNDLNHNGIEVNGGVRRRAGEQTTGRVNLFQGSSSRGELPIPGLYTLQNGGRLLVRDIWYEGAPVPMFYFRNGGMFTYLSGCYAANSKSNIILKDFVGNACIGQLNYSQAGGLNILAEGKTDALRLLLLGCKAEAITVTPGQAGFAMQGCRATVASGTNDLPNQGTSDAAFLRSQLQQARSEVPVPRNSAYTPAVTNLYLHRVPSSGMDGVLITAGNMLAQPKAPMNLRVNVDSASQATLTWEFLGFDEYCFQVERKKPKGEWQRVGMPGAGNAIYQDTYLLPNTVYTYRVTAVNCAGTSPATAEVTVTTPLPDPAGVKINCVGPAIVPFQRDQYGEEGRLDDMTDKPIDLTGVVNPAPMEVYMTSRHWSCSYAIPGQLPGSACCVRLHFAEHSATVKPGDEKMTVDINGKRVLTDFDILAETGAPFKALVKEFTTTADQNGVVTIVFGGVGKVSGIEVIPVVPAP